MRLDFSNIFKFLSLVSPFVLVMMMVLISLFNQNVKGFVYLAGIILALPFNVMLQNLIQSRREASGSDVVCDLFDFPYPSQWIVAYDTPSFNSLMIGFTFIYLFLPMYEKNNMNYPLIIFILILLVIDTVTRYSLKCTKLQGSILGTLLGLMLGTVWYNMFKLSGNTNLLYYDDYTSNKVACSKPNKQTFKCSVYKNGELIKTI